MQKVGLLKRLSAYCLDILFVYLLISAIVSIKAINPTYEKYEKYYDEYSKVTEKYYNKELTAEDFIEKNKDNFYKVIKYSVVSNIVIVVVIISYFGLFQKFNHGQTLGKKIMKFKVVKVNGAEASFWQFFLRLLPMYYLLIGNINSVIINGILVYVLNSNNYLIINSVVTYGFLLLGMTCFIMMLIRKDQRGLHEIISKTKSIEA